MAVVVEAFDGRLLIVRFIRSTWPPLGKSVHWTDFCSSWLHGWLGFCQPMLDPVGFADHVEAHWPRVDGVSVPRLLCELDPARHWARTMYGWLPRDKGSVIFGIWSGAAMYSASDVR